MFIMKQYRLSAGRVKIFILRKDSFTQNYNDIKDLVQIAKQDFPALKTKDIKIVFINKGIGRNTMGIEFRSHEAPLSKYEEIGHIEYIT